MCNNFTLTRMELSLFLFVSWRERRRFELDIKRSALFKMFHVKPKCKRTEEYKRGLKRRCHIQYNHRCKIEFEVCCCPCYNYLLERSKCPSGECLVVNYNYI